jgi:hypothetical protein
MPIGNSRIAALVTTLALAALGFGTAAALATGGASHVLLRSCPGTVAKFEPASFVVACGDGNLAVVKARWATWTTRSASGHGTVKANNCKPDCASGHFLSYPAMLGLSKPKTCKGSVRIWSRLALRFPGKRPVGYKAFQTSSLLC